MAFTQADLDAINAQIATAEKRVQKGDSSVEWQSFEDLKGRRAMILADLEKQESADTGRRRSRFTRLYQGGDGR